jgi:hypothetical protein
MKKLGKIFITAIVLLGCKTEKEIANAETADAENLKLNMTAFAANSEEYSRFSPYIQFLTESEIKDNKQGLISERKQFVESADLPKPSNLIDWKNTHSIDDAITNYKTFCTENINNQSLFVFKQYGPWLILTKLKLLSQTDAKSLDNIYLLLNEMSSVEYPGFGLLNYSLNHLLINKYPKEKISILCEKIVSSVNKAISTKESNWSKDDIQKQLSPNLPQEMKDKIANFIISGDKENLAYLDNIKKLNNSLKQ